MTSLLPNLLQFVFLYCRAWRSISVWSNEGRTEWEFHPLTDWLHFHPFSSEHGWPLHWSKLACCAPLSARSFTSELLPSLACHCKELFYSQGSNFHLFLLNFMRFLLAHSSSLFNSFLCGSSAPEPILTAAPQLGVT